MANGRAVTSGQAGLAFAVAIVADILQLPVNLGYVSVVGAVPAEGVDVFIDTVAAIACTRLLGFHWALLPTFAIEVVPLVDAAPTWTACVAYVVSRRKQEGRLLPSPK